MFAKLSILGLYNYRPDIFDDMALPDGVDKQTVIGTICNELSDFSVIYTQPDILRECIRLWSAVHLPEWTKLHESTLFDYDPISNYDRTEEWTDSANSSGSGVDSVAAFDSVDMVERNKSTATGSSSGMHSGHMYGNIGVTTTQQMIQEEREVVQFNIYDHICNAFKDRFCVTVY